MSWQNQLKGDSLFWLLENDTPGVRYLALRDLLDYPKDDATLLAAKRAAHTTGPIADILAEMDEAGFWVRPGPGYTAKYRGAPWSIIALSQLGASVEMDGRIPQACDYLLDHSLTELGQFTQKGSPSSTIDCLQGNLCYALSELGYEDPRLDLAFEWMARSVVGEGIAPAEDKQANLRYYFANCGPEFACGYNGQKSCTWGAVKIMLAFGKLPAAQKTPLIEKAIKIGADFLLSTDPALADYPNRTDGKPS
jgi:hypothetical protein